MAADCPSDLIDLADRLANIAGAVVRPYFRADAASEDKPDQSPVTVADTQAEAAIRAVIRAERPDHGIVGEEMDSENPDADFLWVIDPIDGTKAFIAGQPVFGTLIALLHRGSPILGVIDQPVLRERWVGAAGRPTTFNGEPVSTLTETDPSRVPLYATSPEMFRLDGDDARFARLASAVRFARYGGDCYAYGLLASGHVGLVVDAMMKPHDYFALIPVIEGAGGVMSDWRGRPLGFGSDGHCLAAANGALHEAALTLLAG